MPPSAGQPADAGLSVNAGRLLSDALIAAAIIIAVIAARTAETQKKIDKNGAAGGSGQIERVSSSD